MWHLAFALARLILISPDGWATPVDAFPKALQPGEALWTWSLACAPQRFDALSDERPPCAPPVAAEVRVLSRDPRGAIVIWGTEAMLRELPDALLPVVTADERGLAALAIPKAERVFARVAGPRIASGWIEVRGASTDIRAAAAITPAFRVLEADGEDALHARVELRTVDEGHLDLVFRGMGDGSVRIPPVPAESAWHILAWSDVGAPLVMRCTPAARPSEIVLPAGFTLRAAVADERERPLPGITMTAAFVVPRERTLIRRVANADDPSARFAVSGLPSGEVRWTIAAPGFARKSAIVHLDGDRDLGTIVLTRPRALAVRVTDEAGRPIRGARITTNAGEEAVSGEDGKARLLALSAEGATLHVSARSFLARDVAVDSNPPRLLTIALAAAAWVRARLVRRTLGVPAGPGTAAVEIDGMQRLVDFGEDGTVVLDGLPPGRLSVELRAEDAAPLRLPERELAAGEQLDLGTIEIAEGLAIVGRLIDEAAAPIPNAVVRVLRPSAGPPLYAYVRRDWSSSASSSDGAFAIRGLAPGVYALWTEARGFAPLVKSGVVVSDDTGAFAIDLGDLTVPAARTLRVSCAPRNRCGSEASVSLTDWLTLSAPWIDGVATIAPLPAGEAVIRLADHGTIVHQQRISIAATEPITEWSVDLSGVLVRGVVTRLGEPLRGGTIVLSTLSESSPPVVMLNHAAGGVSFGQELIGALPARRTAEVDDQGRFVLEDVSPGLYSVTWSDGAARSTPRSVSVVAAKVCNLHFDVPPGMVEGVVRSAAGPSPERVLVSAEQEGRKIDLLTAIDEPFSFTGLDAGSVRLRASTVGLEGGEAEATVEVAQTGTTHVDLLLEPKSRRELSVTVLSEGGAMLANAFVFARSGGALHAALTNADGKAVIRLRRAGSVELAVYSPSHGWSFASVADARTELKMHIRASAAGLVVNAESAVPAVEIWSPTGFPLHQALAILGVPINSRPGQPLRVHGLPPGPYEVAIPGRRHSVTLADEVRTLGF